MINLTSRYLYCNFSYLTVNYIFSPMKKQSTLHLIFFLIMALFMTYCTQEVKDTTIPITTESEVALDLYQQGMKAMADVYLGEAQKLFEKALSEDPDFFMAANRLAGLNMFFGNEEKFTEFSEIALKSTAELSNGELLMQSMLKRFKDDRYADVTDLASQLVDQYPDDEESYFTMASAQGIIEDYLGVVEAYEKALQVTDNQAPVYNMLGYTYMNIEQFDKARTVFDKYLELEPDLPNPYDSKGDFYLSTKEYEKAYESFMKAFEIDSTWSYKKAMSAKAMHDSLEVK